jgi:phosphoglycerol transferase MdoB-like AlkP superfamily enzyme
MRSKVITNIYWVLLTRLFSVFLLLFVSRLVFYFFNQSNFQGITEDGWMKILHGGLHFDLAAILYVNALYIVLQILPFNFRYADWYQKVSKFIFFLFNGAAFFVTCADMIYFKFTLRRTTTTVLKEFSNETNMHTIFWQTVVEYWYVLLVFAVLIYLMSWSYGLVRIKTPETINKKYRVAGSFLFLVLIPILFVGGVRGDFRYSTRPITMSNAGEYVSRPSEIPLVLNTPFCIIRTIRQQFYKPDNYFSESEVSKYYTPIHNQVSKLPFRYENVVVIVLESFERESIGFYNRDLQNGAYKGYTPFFDSLLSKSYVCWNGLANGRKSIDALPSVLAGIPAGELPFVLTPYASNQIHGLPYFLKQKGYHTSFFHGAPNGSMGFKALMNLLGVEHYYGKDEYANDDDFDGTWGIWDEPFFQFYAKTLSTFKQPFFSTLFSVSSHEPFKVPSKYKGVFKSDPANPLREVTAYTDHALQKFFDSAKKMSWFKHTLFVITADHASITSFPNYQNAWGNMAVPILFYHPSDSLQQVRELTAQQTDIMPTVLSYLNFNGSYLSFGKNLLADSTDSYAINYYNGFQIFQDSLLLQLNSGKAVGVYNYKKDPLLAKNLLGAYPTKQDSMENKLKAYIQQYHNRMLKNQLTSQ